MGWILAFLGFGVPLGWLLGLSAASVAASLLASALSALAGASVAVGGMRAMFRERVRQVAARDPADDHGLGDVAETPFPAGLEGALRPATLSGLIVGVALGATLVQHARDGALIGAAHPAAEAREWREAIAEDAGSPDSVARKLFAERHAAAASVAPNDTVTARVPPTKVPGTNINKPQR